MLAGMTVGYHDYEVDPLLTQAMYMNPFAAITTSDQLHLALDRRKLWARWGVRPADRRIRRVRGERRPAPMARAIRAGGLPPDGVTLGIIAAAAPVHSTASAPPWPPARPSA